MPETRMIPVNETQNDKVDKTIEELRQRMKNCLTAAMEDDNLLCYRFLKARDFDVDKSEKMLRKHIIWRKVNQLDNFLEDFKPSEFSKNYLEASLIGCDKDGDLVRYCAAGNLDFEDLLKAMRSRYHLKHWIWTIETNLSILKENQKTGSNGYRGSLIFNGDKLSFANVTSRVVADLNLELLKMYQDNYPELLKCAIVINAPPYTVLIFQILKGIMSNTTLKKIHVFGCSGWKEKLLEFIDADVLPKFLGGNRTDPDGDPLCKSFLNHAGKIPHIYFLSDNERYFKDPTQVQTIVIPRNEKEKIDVELKHVGTVLQWEFLVKGKDIGFGIFFETSEQEVTEVIPIEKYATPDGSEKHCLKCRVIGKYIVVFDNSYSWLSSKEIQYCITVVEP